MVATRAGCGAGRRVGLNRGRPCRGYRDRLCAGDPALAVPAVQSLIDSVTLGAHDRAFSAGFVMRVQSGQALVEWALSAFVLLLLALGILAVGQVVGEDMAIRSAATQAAFAAARAPSAQAAQTAGLAAGQEAVRGAQIEDFQLTIDTGSFQRGTALTVTVRGYVSLAAFPIGRQEGQILVMSALVMAFLFVPLSVFVIDTALVESGYAQLGETLQASAEDGASTIDEAAYRSSNGRVAVLDPVQARIVADGSIRAAAVRGLSSWSVEITGQRVTITGRLVVQLLVLGAATLTESRSATFAYGQ